MERLEPFEMLRLGCARGVVGREARPTRGGRLRLGDEQRPPVVEGEPGFPLGVRKADAVLERVTERR